MSGCDQPRHSDLAERNSQAALGIAAIRQAHHVVERARSRDEICTLSYGVVMMVTIPFVSPTGLVEAERD